MGTQTVVGWIARMKFLACGVHPLDARRLVNTRP